TPVNVAPTLNPIPNPAAVIESNVEQFITVNLTGITAGGGNQTQTLTVQAVSNNSNLIDPNSLASPNYISPNTTGSLRIGILPNASGVATITVSVMDNGGTANGGVDTTFQTFKVTVIPINVPPTLDPIANPPALLENTITATATATIGSGAAGGQVAAIAAT